LSQFASGWGVGRKIGEWKPHTSSPIGLQSELSVWSRRAQAEDFI